MSVDSPACVACARAVCGSGVAAGLGLRAEPAGSAQVGCGPALALRASLGDGRSEVRLGTLLLDWTANQGHSVALTVFKNAASVYFPGTDFVWW